MAWIIHAWVEFMLAPNRVNIEDFPVDLVLSKYNKYAPWAPLQV
jgi:hypothetical protein